MFDYAAADYAERYQGLLRSRGVVDPAEVERWESVWGADDEPPAYAEVAAALASGLPSGGLLFYLYSRQQLGERAPAVLHVWLLTGSGAGPFYESRLVHADTLAAAIRTLRQAMGVEALFEQRAPRYRGVEAASADAARPALGPALLRATDLLLPPSVREGLRGLDRLAVLPAGEIATVPFAALEPFGDGRALIDAMTVSTAPSLGGLVGALRARGAVRAGAATPVVFRTPLVVGNPAFGEGQDPSLPPLPGAMAEARAVGRLVGAAPLVGAEATLDSVVARAPLADLLYFATHGAADPDRPLDAGGLYFAGGRAWTAREIQHAGLGAARLAVLSACQTGLGRAHDAGVVGLGRAFSLAGVDDVVVSLWSVDNGATVHLMTEFVRRLLGEDAGDVAAALRHATLDTKALYDGPVYWAPFVHFGVP